MACRMAATPHSHYASHLTRPQPVWAGPSWKPDLGAWRLSPSHCLSEVLGGGKDRRMGLNCRRSPGVSCDQCTHSLSPWFRLLLLLPPPADTPGGQWGVRQPWGSGSQPHSYTGTRAHTHIHTHTHSLMARRSLVINLLKPSCLLITLNLALHR